MVAVRWTTACLCLAARAGAYHAGEPASLGADLGPPTPGRRSSTSVAARTEQESGPGRLIRYLSPHIETLDVRFGQRQRRRSDGEDESFWDEVSPGKWEFGEYVDGVWTADKSAGSMPPWVKDTLNEDGTVKKPEELVPTVGGGLKRCGFTWDDAAAKVGSSCTADSDCLRPEESKLLWPANANYSCFADVPNYERGEQGECRSSDGKG